MNRKYLAHVNKWHVKSDNIFAFIAAALVVGMTLLGTVDVVGRYFFNRPVPGTYEIMRYMLGGIVFLTFAYVQLSRGHITVNLLTERLQGKKALLLDLIVLFIMLIVTILIGWYGGEAALEAWRAGDKSMGTIELPTGPARMVVPVGCALLAMRIVSQLVESVNKLIRG